MTFARLTIYQSAYNAGRFDALNSRYRDVPAYLEGDYEQGRIDALAARTVESQAQANLKRYKEQYGVGI